MFLYHFNQPVVEPSPELLDKVMAAIRQRQELSLLKRKLFFSSLIFSANALLFIPVVGSFARQAKTSGVFGYLSLAVSDIKTLSVYWQDLAWSLLESFPVAEMAGLLTLTVLVGGALMAMYQYSKSIRGLSHLIHN